MCISKHEQSFKISLLNISYSSNFWPFTIKMNIKDLILIFGPFICYSHSFHRHFWELFYVLIGGSPKKIQYFINTCICKSTLMVFLGKLSDFE